VHETADEGKIKEPPKNEQGLDATKSAAVRPKKEKASERPKVKLTEVGKIKALSEI